MHFSTYALSAISMVGTASAHMVMANPVPYGKSSLNNSPLLPDGSDFPCKQRSGVYDAQGASNVFPAGSSQSLSFTGSAVHGGGSCQLSVTTDPQPSKNSDWRVIHSIEGGCPAKNQDGNLPADPSGSGASVFQWTVPAELAGGNFTLAWTWFNRIGNREMYMNCAPLTVTGGSSKIKARSEDIIKRNVQSFLTTLPSMFVANVGNGCGTSETTNLQFPNPGSSVEKNPAFGFAPPTGSCAAAVAVPAGGSGSAASSPAAAAPASTSIAATTVPAAAASSNTGGVFVPISTATVSPVAAASTTMATVAIASGISAPAAASTGTANSASAGAQPQGSACSPEGVWNCLPGGMSYQQCGSGIWTPVMPMAAGTSCQPGLGALKMSAIRRSVRFSPAHRHHHRS